MSIVATIGLMPFLSAYMLIFNPGVNIEYVITNINI